MRRLQPYFLLVVLILGVSSSVQGQVRGFPGRQDSQASDNLPYLEGTVLAGGGNTAVPGAVVRLIGRSNSDLAQTYADSQGEFSFYHMRDGMYQLSVSHPDFEDASVSILVIDSPVQGLRIPLTPKVRAEGNPAVPPVGLWALQIPEQAKNEYNKGMKEMARGQTGESGKKAAQHFRNAIQLYAQYASAYSALGSLLLQQGKTGEARAAFQQGLAIDENLLDACFGLGALESAEGRHQSAEELLLRARLLMPNNWRVEYELGRLFWRMGEWTKAEVHLRQASAEPREVAQLYLLLINSLAMQEKYPETLAAMDDFLSRFSKDQFAEQVRKKRALLQAELSKTVKTPQ